MIYLCTRFPKEMRLERVSEKVLKIFEKNFLKVLVVQKNDLPLHHFPLRKTDGTEQNENRSL